MSNLNIYLLSNPTQDYETYTDMLIAATSPSEAKDISIKSVDSYYQEDVSRVWVSHSQMDTIKVKLMGTAHPTIKKGFIQGWWKNG